MKFGLCCYAVAVLILLFDKWRARRRFGPRKVGRW